jgi:hypothetical protein
MESVSLPFWLFLLLGLFAAWAAAEHVLLPALRWVVRRRIDAVLQELGPRLQLEIPPLKLARREVMIERLRHKRTPSVAACERRPWSGSQAMAPGVAGRYLPCISHQAAPA